MDFNVPLDKIEKSLLRGISGLLILFLVYCGFSSLIKKQIEEKNMESDNSHYYGMYIGNKYSRQ